MSRTKTTHSGKTGYSLQQLLLMHIVQALLWYPIDTFKSCSRAYTVPQHRNIQEASRLQATICLAIYQSQMLIIHCTRCALAGQRLYSCLRRQLQWLHFAACQASKCWILRCCPNSSVLRVLGLPTQVIREFNTH